MDLVKKPGLDFKITIPRAKPGANKKEIKMISAKKERELLNKFQQSDFIAFKRIKLTPFDYDDLVKELEDIFEYYNTHKKISEPTKESLSEATRMVKNDYLNYMPCLWHRSRMMLCDYRVLLFYAFDELEHSKLSKNINEICGTDDLMTIFSIIVQDYTERHPEVVHVLKTISKIRAHYMVKDDLWDSGFIGF